MSVRSIAISALLLCLLASLGLSQQGSSSIVGTVTDPSGAAVAGAEVTIINSGTSASHTVTTNSTGAYQLANVEVGTYNVIVKNAGFKTYEQTGVTVNVSSTVRADVALQIGQTSENITVSAEALQVQSESSEQSNLITSEQIENIATNGRNVINLATIGTGVSSALPSFNQPTSITASSAIASTGSARSTTFGSSTEERITTVGRAAASPPCLHRTQLASFVSSPATTAPTMASPQVEPFRWY